MLKNLPLPIGSGLCRGLTIYLRVGSGNAKKINNWIEGEKLVMPEDRCGCTRKMDLWDLGWGFAVVCWRLRHTTWAANHTCMMETCQSYWAPRFSSASQLGNALLFISDFPATQLPWFGSVLEVNVCALRPHLGFPYCCFTESQACSEWPPVGCSKDTICCSPWAFCK